jgi:hypothetical protein
VVQGRSSTCLRRRFGRQGIRPQLSALRILLRSKARGCARSAG